MFNSTMSGTPTTARRAGATKIAAVAAAAAGKSPEVDAGSPIVSFDSADLSNNKKRTDAIRRMFDASSMAALPLGASPGAAATGHQIAGSGLFDGGAISGDVLGLERNERLVYEFSCALLSNRMLLVHGRYEMSHSIENDRGSYHPIPSTHLLNVSELPIEHRDDQTVVWVVTLLGTTGDMNPLSVCWRVPLAFHLMTTVHPPRPNHTAGCTCSRSTSSSTLPSLAIGRA